MVLGNADNLRVATTLKDFDRKWIKTPTKARPDLGTSIPVSIKGIQMASQIS